MIPLSAYMNFQIVATTISEVIVGRKNDVRKSARSRRLSLSRMAVPSPRSGPIAIPMTTKKTVFWNARWKRGLARTSA